MIVEKELFDYFFEILYYKVNKYWKDFLNFNSKNGKSDSNSL